MNYFCSLRHLSFLKPSRRLLFFIFSFFFLTVGGAFFSVAEAGAASLYLSPSSASYAIRQNFTVNVMVSSNDQAMNALSGTISFPADRLQVASVSKSGSAVTLWVSEPSFSNGAGTVNFEGVVLNPGYKGGGTKVLSITFRGVKAGAATVRFSSGQILANDGQGTDITKGLGSGTYTIEDKEEAPPKPVEPMVPPPVVLPVPGEAPGFPVIQSSSHPNPDEWYRGRDLVISWDLPKTADRVSVSVDNNKNSIPAMALERTDSKLITPGLEDGIWYAHVRYKNAKGWGPVAHFRVQVDTSAPSGLTVKDVTTDHEKSTTQFLIQSSDQTSGIDRYELRIDDGKSFIWHDTKDHLYTTNELDIGKHTFSVTAYDRAGNAFSKSTDFIVQGTCPSTKATSRLIDVLLVGMFVLLLLAILFIILYLHARRQLILLRASLVHPEKEKSNGTLKSRRRRI